MDQYLNIKLDDVSVVEEIKYPHLVSGPSPRDVAGWLTEPRALPPGQSAVKNVFIRGSVVRYVHLPAQSVDVALLEDATRRGACPPANASCPEAMYGR